MNKRHYYIDWIRIALIGSVFFFHVGMIFNGWEWHIKNDVRFEALNPVMEMLHSWRMPLLFMVSGAGTRFALGFRSIRNYFFERTKRLLLPLLFGIIVLVPVQVYIERISLYANLWDFYPHFFEGVYPEGNFSWHHLWFIVYLYFISIAFIPFILFFRSTIYSELIEPKLEKLSSRTGGIGLFFLPIVFSQVLLRPYFPEETHAFYNDWAFMTLFFLYFLLGFCLLGNRRIVSNIMTQRRIWLGTSVFAVMVWLGLSELSYSAVSQTARDLIALLMAWVISLAVLGYGGKYLDKDHVLRNPLNKAIYPFYLIHQPVIIVVGYWVIALPLAGWEKAMLLTLGGLLIISIIYTRIISRSTYLACCFGLRRRRSC